MKLTIGIKSLNEERNIEAALRSALRAAAPFYGEVVLADSGSTDRTIEISRQYPVCIVCLSSSSERSCGVAAQLAFQHSSGEFFLMMDGDMTLYPAFLPAALAYLNEHPDTAGVGGHVRDVHVGNQEFRIRTNAARADPDRVAGTVTRLDGGGLYRTAAIREVGYFADRNLHAFEEFELAARLQCKGWKLARIDEIAMDHHGHTIGGYALLWRRAVSGYSSAPGEVLRAAFGAPHFRFVLRELRHIWFGAVVIAWWLIIAIAAVFAISSSLAATVMMLLIAGPVMALAYRRCSFSLGVYSFLSWNISAWGLLRGFFRKRKSPTEPIESVVAAGRSPAAPMSEL